MFKNFNLFLHFFVLHVGQVGVELLEVVAPFCPGVTIDGFNKNVERLL